MNGNGERDLRLYAIPDTHGHAKGEHKPYAEERPLPLTARMLFLWFYHACRRGYPRFLMVADHMNYLTFEDPAAVNLVRRALKLAQAGDLYGAAETAGVDVGHAAVVSQGLQRGMRYSIGAEVDNDPRSRPDAQNIVDAMRPDAMIRSVHFIPITHPALGENWPWPFDNPEFKDLFEVVGVEKLWEQYVTLLVDAIERLPGHIVGHFFVPAVFGHWPDDAALDAYENRVLDAAEARGLAVEFNTRFLYRENDEAQKARYLEANKRFLRKAKERGIGIAIGSDAHSPKDQGGAFDLVLNVLDELEINEIVFPLAGTLRRVALRIVREPEPEPVPEPEPPKAAEPAEPVAPAKPKAVRKARPSSKATRPPETSPERPPERPETAAAAPEPAPPAEPPAAEAAEPAPADVRHAAKSAPANAPEPAPTNPPEPAATHAPEPAATHAAEPVTANAPEKAASPPPKSSAPAKAPAKAAPAKAAPAKAAAKPARAKAPAKHVPAKAAAAKPAAHMKGAPAKKAVSAKAGAKKAASAKAPAKKAAPARAAAKKAVPARKAAPAKKASKKSAPARATAKKAAPAKKAAAKKAAPARKAPARKSSAAKKTTKKTATRRR